MGERRRHTPLRRRPAHAPLTGEDAERVPAAADRVPRAVAHRHTESGIAELRVHSLLTPEGEGGWRLHPVTLHAWHHHDPAPARTEALRHAVLRTLCARRAPVTPGLPR